MAYPNTVDPVFVSLAETYKKHPIEFPQLKGVTLAQWALESGWGNSSLAAKFKNFAGMKWRTYMADFAQPVKYSAHDGVTEYCQFETNRHFIEGFWARLDKESMYKGWRKFTKDGETWIGFVGPIWYGLGVDPGKKYVGDVMRIHDAWEFTKEMENGNASKTVDWDHIRTHLAGRGTDPRV